MPFSFRSIINNGFGRKALKKHSISHFGILIVRRYRISDTLLGTQRMRRGLEAESKA